MTEREPPPFLRLRTRDDRLVVVMTSEIVAVEQREDGATLHLASRTFDVRENASQIQRWLQGIVSPTERMQHSATQASSEGPSAEQSERFFEQIGNLARYAKKKYGMTLYFGYSPLSGKWAATLEHSDAPGGGALHGEAYNLLDAVDGLYMLVTGS